MAERRQKRVEVDELPSGDFEALVARLRAERAVLRKGALRVVLSKRGEANLRDALARSGFEAGKRFFRLGLTSQVQALLAEHGSVPVSTLKSRLAGLEAAGELKEAVADLHRGRAARLVLRDGTALLVSPQTEVLDRAALDSALKLAVGLVRLLRAAKTSAKKAPPVQLAASDLRRSVAAISPASSPPPALRAAPPSPLDVLLTAVEDLISDREPMAFIPSLVDALSETIPAAEVTKLLLDAAVLGLIELRPDSGVQLVAPELLAVCPRGPTGVPLTFARPLAKTRLPSKASPR